MGRRIPPPKAKLPSTGSHSLSASLGEVIETGNALRIADEARRSGLYILGRSGMGKTNLLLHLMNQDIQNGHGIFFLDPHGDAAAELIARHCSYDTSGSGGNNTVTFNVPFRLLNPLNEKQTFGINLLACKDPASLKERSATYNRARLIFHKLFKTEFGEKPWLQLIMQYTIYAFIENQEFTLAEVPMFLEVKNPDHRPFREHILNNIKHEPDVVRFWRNEFRTEREKDPERVDAFLTRVQLLLGHRLVRDILGQHKTTINFSELMNQRLVLLVRLPRTLAPDIKTIIGTAIFSELVNAVYHRDELPVAKRRHFCIFVDEFQTFSSSEDFAALFAEARKYRVSTAVAHQERFGQMAENKPILGATDGAGNKILFQTSNMDAVELASEFAQPSPVEIKYEREYVLSQQPFPDLLQGHGNPQIQDFVNTYLRPMQERLEDVRSEMEGTRLERMDLLDEASLFRLDERIEGIDRRYQNLDSRYAALQQAEHSLLAARQQAARLRSLHEQTDSIRLSQRALNRFFSAVMEGTLYPGQDAFSNCLINWALHSSYVPSKCRTALWLYIATSYGDPATVPAIPFDFAREYSLFHEQVRAIEQAERDRLQKGQDAVLKSEYDRIAAEFRRAKAKAHELKQAHTENMRKEIANWQWDFGRLCAGLPIHLALPIFEEPRVRQLLMPYFSGRFAPPWNALLPNRVQLVSSYFKYIADERERTRRGMEYFRHYNPAPYSLDEIRYKLRGGWFWLGRDACPKGELWEPFILDECEQFLRQYGEGALVTLALLMTIEEPRRWRKSSLSRSAFCSSTFFPDWGDVHGYDRYPLYNMLYLPSVEGRDPLEVLTVLNCLAEALRSTDYRETYRPCCWRCEMFYYQRRVDYGYEPRSCYVPYNDSFHEARYFLEELSELEMPRDEEYRGRAGFEFAILKAALEKNPSRNAEMRLLEKCSPLIKRYLFARAWSLAKYGQALANKTFPQPSVASATATQISSMVTFLVMSLQEEWQRFETSNVKGIREYRRSQVQEAVAKAHPTNALVLPQRITPERWGDKERNDLRRACKDALLQQRDGQWDPYQMFRMLEDLVQLCGLLKSPQHQILVPSGRYIEKQVKTYSPGQMRDEMVQELTRLDPYEAYAKIIHQDGGERKTAISRIRTPRPPAKPEGYDELDRFIEQAEGASWKALGSEVKASNLPDLLCAAVEMTTLEEGLCRTRTEIDEEIRQRQEKWLGERPPSGSLRQPPPRSSY